MIIHNGMKIHEKSIKNLLKRLPNLTDMLAPL